MNRTLIALRQPTLRSFEYLTDDFTHDFFNQIDQELSPFIETDEAFLTSLDMPGVDKNDINVEVEDNKIHINAERKNHFEKQGFTTKKYQSAFVIPKKADRDQLSAHYENGVLTLAIAKKAEHKFKKKIEISSGEKPKFWSNLLSFGKTETLKN